MRAEIEKAVVEAGVDQREHLPLAALEKLEYTNAFIKVWIFQLLTVCL
jgi:hypothetical protein